MYNTHYYTYDMIYTYACSIYSVYIYIFYILYIICTVYNIWLNKYNDLTATEPWNNGSDSRNYPWSYFRRVNSDKLPRCITYIR